MIYPNFLTPDEKLKRLLDKEAKDIEQRFSYYKSRYEETGDPKWKFIAYKEGYDVDWTPTDDVYQDSETLKENNRD